jgi:FkbH-like protein
MKLAQALKIINRQTDPHARVKSFFLACGFTPLHLQTFLHAYLQCRFPEERVAVSIGLYGDLVGNLLRACACSVDAAGVAIEWADLDSRLGIRQLGGWLPETLPNILANVLLSLERLEVAVNQLAASCPVVLSLPTLPLPPLDLPPGFQAGVFELQLREYLASFAARASLTQGLRIVNLQRLDALSPLSQRFDAKSELLTGFPYRLEHAEKLANLFCTLLCNPPPKKGLITDLDETFWKGILGEIGVDGICWDLAGHGQVHGIYQQFLHSLAQRGILIAAASKNDSTLVAQAFRRPDIHLPVESVFPIEAHWKPKSESVSRILKAWNIGADAVAFVDDNPMELTEVRAAHAGIECFLFPKDDPDAVLVLLERLRELFGKTFISEEDRIRSGSIRAAAELQDAVSGSLSSYEEVLKQSEGRIHFHLGNKRSNNRAFELVSKTNQFNLNGRRYAETEWQSYFRQDGAFLLTLAYQDKFGPLGEIAALLGRKMPNRTLRIDTWVMSCRAFSRRIEYQCLRYLFANFDVEEIVFDWVATSRNGPLSDFLGEFGELQREFRLSRTRLEAACPALFHVIEETVRG